MHPPAGYLACGGEGGVGVVRADLADVPMEVWWGRGVPLAHARGRGDGIAVLAPRPALRVAARTYRRGGVLGRLLPARYFDPARPQRELQVLVALRAAGVPVVEPVAALARRDGHLWRLRLLTVLVQGALPLPAFVAAHPQRRRSAVAAAGRVVAAAFAAGLCHADLHPDNLIAAPPADGSGPAAAPAVFLLDLDRARMVAEVTAAMRAKMLARMARYLIRHRAHLPVLPSRTDAWRFLAGMGLDRAQRRSLAGAVAARLRRQLALRLWLRGADGGRAG